MKKDKLYTVNKWNQPMLGGNLYAFGDWLNKQTQSMETWMGANNMSPSTKGLVSGLGTGIGQLGNSLLSNGYSTGAGSAVTNIGGVVGSTLSTVNPLLGGIVSAGSGLIGGFISGGWGTKENKGNINTLNANIAAANMAGNALAGSTTSSDFFSNSGLMTTGTGFNTTDLVKGGWFAKGKARRKGQKYLDKEANALAMQNQGMVTGANNVDSYMDDAIMGNFAAFGGPLGLGDIGGAVGIMQADKYINAINNRTNAIARNNTAPQGNGFNSLTTNRFSEGGSIHIKPENKGKFTAKAKRAGMGVQEYASHVLGNKEDYPSSTVKQANFARNAAGWKHAIGGGLEGAFLDNFSKDPIQAALAYTQSLDALDAERAAQAEALAQQQALEDMQLKLANAETQRQGLQALIDSQALDIKNLQDAQALQAKASQGDWTTPIVEATDNAVAKASNIISTAADKNKNWQYIKKRLKESGKFNDTQIEGIKLNLQRESGFNWQDRSGDNGSAWGLAQWHKPRRPKDMSFDGQINHLIDTLYNYDGTDHWIGKSNFNGFMNARTPEEAHYYIAKGWERPSEKITNALKLASDKSLKKLAFGGELGTNGTDFTNGLLEINTGSSHEDNPHQGVQLGVDANGVPNLVEEGETVYNDYVFSDRMTVPAFMRKELGLGGSSKKDITFADASKKLAEVAKERPTNPIDQAGLDASLGKLAQVQEAERARMQAEQDNQAMQEYLNSPMAAYGGKQGKKYATGGKKGKTGLNTYAFDPIDQFKYWNKDTKDYDSGYRDFIENKLNEDWINRVMKGQYGDMSRYLGANNVNPTIAQARTLGLDTLNSDWHKAMALAYDDYLKGIDPLTGVGTSPEIETTAPNINTSASGTITHFVRGENGIEDALQGDPSTWVGVDPKEIDRFVDPKTGNTYIYHRPLTQNPTFTEDELQAAADKIRGLSKDEFSPLPTWMRYAPIAGAGIMALTDALGLTNKPDYTYANKLEAAANRAGYAPNIQPRFIGDYLRYQPMDIWAEQNRLNANTRATDRALINNSAPIGTRAAGLLANEYNNQIGSGELYRRALEYNDANRQQVAGFNRGTNMFNAQMGMQADEANARYRQAANHYVMSGLAQAAALRDSIDQRVGASRSANITNFLTSLGNLGRENFAMNQINSDRSRRHGLYTTGESYDKIAKDFNTGAFGGAVERYQKNKKKGRR